MPWNKTAEAGRQAGRSTIIGGWPGAACPPSRYDVGRLSPEEFQLMEAFLLRRDELAVEVRISMARKITQRIAGKLGVSEDDQRRPEGLLETLVAEYRDQARFR